MRFFINNRVDIPGITQAITTRKNTHTILTSNIYAIRFHDKNNDIIMIILFRTLENGLVFQLNCPEFLLTFIFNVLN